MKERKTTVGKFAPVLLPIVHFTVEELFLSNHEEEGGSLYFVLLLLGTYSRRNESTCLYAKTVKWINSQGLAVICLNQHQHSGNSRTRIIIIISPFLQLPFYFPSLIVGISFWFCKVSLSFFSLCTMVNDWWRVGGKINYWDNFLWVCPFWGQKWRRKKYSLVSEMKERII